MQREPYFFFATCSVKHRPWMCGIPSATNWYCHRTITIALVWIATMMFIYQHHISRYSIGCRNWSSFYMSVELSTDSIIQKGERMLKNMTAYDLVRWMSRHVHDLYIIWTAGFCGAQSVSEWTVFFSLFGSIVSANMIDCDKLIAMLLKIMLVNHFPQR